MFKREINIKSIIILLSMILFIFFASHKMNHYSYKYTDGSVEQCMGIPVITEEMFEAVAYHPVEANNIVCMNGTLLPYDKAQNCLFLSCNITKETKYTDMAGIVKSEYPDYQLYFLKEEAFEDMAESVKKGHQFTLAAVDLDGNYMRYQLIFTTLPIVEMHGESTEVDSRDREIYYGKLSVWNPSEQASGEISVTTNRLEWKIRGYTAMEFPKKSYKLSLKDKNRKSENVSLLGLEKDDDYILNPMWMDDLKVREKLAITLWNEIAEEEGSTFRMSDAEYCEVIINGSYQGICLLQKRIEKKTLKLDKEDILFKGSGLDATEDSVPEDIFEVIYTPIDEQGTYAAMESFLYSTDFSTINKESWVDNQLFIQLGHMIDNRRFKNMYYIVDRSGAQESIYFLPWDTDMSFGVAWNKGFAYKPDSVENIAYRIEYDAIVAQYPELENMLAERWSELRKAVFSKEHILEIINTNFEKLDASGVLERDYQVLNENAWGGRDTRENLEAYIIRRLEILDEKYGLK